MNPLRAAFYARVSSEQQATAHTIESQIAALSERAQVDGLSVPPERQFVDDGYSGATLIRPAMDRLRDLTSLGAVDRIYVHSPDRLARNYAYQVLLIDEWRRAGVEVVFLNRPLGQSPEDDLLLQVQGIVSEYERAQIMERSRRGKRHAALRGSLSVLSHAPYGYRYVTVRDGQGQARLDIIAEQADVVKDIFAWVGRERCTLGAVTRRLRAAGRVTVTGKRVWSRQTVWHILQNPVYKGTAGYGKTRMMPRTKKVRLRPSRGRPAEPRRSSSAVATDPKAWILLAAPAIIDPALFKSAQDQLRENRTRARPGLRGPAYLLQGLTCCGLCGYAFSGKTTRQTRKDRALSEFRYYRCSGTDAYRFGGERVCGNTQIHAASLEDAVWECVCNLLTNPGSLEEISDNQRNAVPEAVDGLRVRRQKLQQGLERLIDSLAEGVIDKDQFTARVNRTKARIAELETRIGSYAADEERLAQILAMRNRLVELSTHLGSPLKDADWCAKREIIRASVQRIEITPTEVAVVLRPPVETRSSTSEPIVLKLPRPCRRPSAASAVSSRRARHKA